MSLDNTLAPEIDDLINGELGFRIHESDEEPEELVDDWEEFEGTPLSLLLTDEERNSLTTEQLEDFNFQMFRYARELLGKMLE